MPTKTELEADVAFLLARANQANYFSLGKNRDTGASSNALVRFAYTKEEPKYWPHDQSDYAACLRAFASLPAHRRTPEVGRKLQELYKRMVTRQQ